MIRLVYNSHHMSERPQNTLEYDGHLHKRVIFLCFFPWDNLTWESVPEVVHPIKTGRLDLETTFGVKYN